LNFKAKAGEGFALTRDSLEMEFELEDYFLESTLVDPYSDLGYVGIKLWQDNKSPTMCSYYVGLLIQRSWTANGHYVEDRSFGIFRERPNGASGSKYYESVKPLLVMNILLNDDLEEVSHQSKLFAESFIYPDDIDVSVGGTGIKNNIQVGNYTVWEAFQPFSRPQMDAEEAFKYLARFAIMGV
jgi:hypothetical protein